MSLANPLWGAPRVHGELLKLGIGVGQTSSVAKYRARRRGPPSQGLKTFLRNHADGIAAMDLFVVADGVIPAALGSAQPPVDLGAWSHGASDCRVVGQSTRGSSWLGARPGLPDP